MILIPFYIILFFAFFGNSLIDYQIIPKPLEILVEGSVYAIFLSSLLISGKNKRKYSLPLLFAYLLFALIALTSSLINKSIDYHALLNLRLIIRYYLLYLAIINIGLNEKQLYKINKIIFYLFIIQLPAQAIKFYFYGFSENTIGTYGTHGGGLTTIIPLVALGYLIAYYFLYKEKVILLILSGWFIAYGIIGLKLALLFLYPVAFVSIYYLNAINIRGLRIPGDIYRFVVIMLLIIPIGFTIIKHQRRINPERTVGGSVDLSYAFKSSLDYTTRSRASNSELALGRVATTKLAFKYLWEEGIITFSFGYGPGIINKLTHYTLNKKYETRMEKIVGSYGKTGAVYVVTQYGVFGLTSIIIIFSIFLRKSWQLYVKEKEPYWKAFASGSLFFACVNLFIFVSYNTLTLVGDTIVPVFFYCMALVYNRSKIIDKSMEINNG